MASITLTNLNVSVGSVFQFGFTNVPGALFNAFGSASLSTPPSNWMLLGGVPEISAGQFLFSNTISATNQAGFYRVASP